MIEKTIDPLIMPDVETSSHIMQCGQVGAEGGVAGVCPVGPAGAILIHRTSLAFPFRSVLTVTSSGAWMQGQYGSSRVRTAGRMRCSGDPSKCRSGIGPRTSAMPALGATGGCGEGSQ